MQYSAVQHSATSSSGPLHGAYRVKPSASNRLRICTSVAAASDHHHPQHHELSPDNGPGTRSRSSRRALGLAVLAALPVFSAVQDKSAIAATDSMPPASPPITVSCYNIAILRNKILQMHTSLRAVQLCNFAMFLRIWRLCSMPGWCKIDIHCLAAHRTGRLLP